MEHFHHLKSSLVPCTLLSAPSPPPPLAPGNHCSAPVTTDGITQSVFCVWRLLLSVIFLSFIHVVYMSSLFLLIGEQYSFAWLDHNTLIFLVLMGVWVASSFFIIMNKAPTYVQSLYINVFISLGFILRSWIVGSYSKFMFNFMRSCQIVLRVVLFHIPTKTMKVPDAPQPLQHSVLFIFLTLAIQVDV